MTDKLVQENIYADSHKAILVTYFFFFLSFIQIT